MSTRRGLCRGKSNVKGERRVENGWGRRGKQQSKQGADWAKLVAEHKYVESFPSRWFGWVRLAEGRGGIKLPHCTFLSSVNLRNVRNWFAQTSENQLNSTTALKIIIKQAVSAGSGVVVEVVQQAEKSRAAD